MIRKSSRLKLWRIANGQKLRDAGRVFEISGETFRQLESGRLNPSERLRARYEAYFGEPFERLLQPETPRRGIPRVRCE